MKGMKMSIRWQAVLLGLGVGMLTVVCGCAAASALLVQGAVERDTMGLWAAAAALRVRGAVDLDTMGLWAAGITLGSGLLGSLAAMLGGGGGADALLATAGVLVVLFGLNGLLCGGQVEGAAVTALALGGGSGAAVLLRMGQGTGHRKRRRRRKS